MQNGVNDHAKATIHPQDILVDEVSMLVVRMVGRKRKISDRMRRKIDKVLTRKAAEMLGHMIEDVREAGGDLAYELADLQARIQTDIRDHLRALLREISENMKSKKRREAVLSSAATENSGQEKPRHDPRKYRFTIMRAPPISRRTHAYSSEWNGGDTD